MAYVILLEAMMAGNGMHVPSVGAVLLMAMACVTKIVPS
jgi:hypothetical protein